jgi:hypothetical protein
MAPIDESPYVEGEQEGENGCSAPSLQLAAHLRTPVAPNDDRLAMMLPQGLMRQL